MRDSLELKIMLTVDCERCQGSFELSSLDDDRTSCPRCQTVSTYQGAPQVTLTPGATTAPGDTRPLARIALSPGFRKRYRMSASIGRGTFGWVMRARDLIHGDDVAIKFLVALGDPTLLVRFMREWEILDTIVHPNVIRVRELAEQEGHPYLVMELLEGGTLRQRLAERSRMGIQETVDMARDVLSGLAACHERGVVHRDLKPENILYTRAGQAKISDLGIARLTDPDGIQLTLGEGLVGTPRYVSPEQVRDRNVTPRSDLYSLGLVLYEALAGQVAFPETDLYALLTARVDRDPPPLAEVAPRVPGPLAGFVEELMRRDPAGRPASAKEALQRLDIVTVAITGLLPPPPQAAAGSRRKAWTRALVVVAPIFLLLPALAVHPGKGGRPPPAPVSGSGPPATAPIGDLELLASPGTPVPQRIGALDRVLHGQIGDREAQLLGELLIDPSKEMKHSVNGMLISMLMSRRLPLLSLVPWLEDPRPPLRKQALKLASSLEAAALPLAPAVIRRLQDPSPEIRARAIETVEDIKLDPMEIIHQVSPLLRDPDPRVRKEATHTLARFQARPGPPGR